MCPKEPLLTRFFPNLARLNQYTLSLDSLAHPPVCSKCHQCGHFVSHGFIYRKRPHGEPQPVGKRIYCSNRCQRKGCGGTRRLYLADILPLLRVTTTQVFGFVQKWLSGDTQENAYLASTGTLDARNAHRWVRKLALHQADYRKALPFGSDSDPAPSPGRPSRAALFSVLARLIRVFHDGNACASWQLTQQIAFL